MPLLTDHDWRERLARSLDEANREAHVELVGFVFMPEHVHLLVHLTDPAQSVGRYLARFKQPFSAQIKEILVRNRSALLPRLTARERPGKHCFRFWQEGSGYDRNLFSPKAIEASLDDIHQNPVSRGACQDVLDWRWSWAHFYLGRPSSQPSRVRCADHPMDQSEWSAQRTLPGYYQDFRIVYVDTCGEVQYKEIGTKRCRKIKTSPTTWKVVEID